MPKTKSKNVLKSLPVAELAYAVGRLVAAGKTTEAEVLRLASERGTRIAALQAELDALLQGGTPTPKAVAVATRAPAKAPKAAKAAPKAAPKAKTSAKQAAARKAQGQYLGYLRNFVGAQRAHIMALGKKNGIPAAVAAMIKLRGKKVAPAKKAIPAEAVASKKAPKAKKAGPAKKKLALSPQRKAQLKLQGAYIGFMRSLPAAEKAKIKAISAAKGMKAAVEVMRKNASGK
jgi:hypothetical protein